MKHDLTTGTWQDDTGCPISIILVSTSDVGRFEFTGNCTLPSAASVHGMGTMPLVGIVQRIGKNKQNRRHNSMDHGEGTCLASNIAAK